MTKATAQHAAAIGKRKDTRHWIVASESELRLLLLGNVSAALLKQARSVLRDPFAPPPVPVVKVPDVPDPSLCFRQDPTTFERCSKRAGHQGHCSWG